MSGDNYLVTTLERVVAPKGAVYLGGGGGGVENSVIRVLPFLARRVEDHQGTDT